MTTSNYLLFVGTWGDKKENISPENRDVLDIAETLQRKGYHPTLLLGESGVDHNRWAIDTPYLSQKIGRELSDTDSYYRNPKKLQEKVIKVDYVVCEKPNFITAFGLGELSTFRKNNSSDKPRDSFMQWGETLHIPELYTDKVSEYTLKNEYLLEQRQCLGMSTGPFEATGWLRVVLPDLLQKRNISLNFEYNSPFGEGGKIINLEKFILASSQIKGQTETVPLGLPVYYVDPVACNILNETMTPEQHLYHIDYHVNGTSYQDTTVLLVDPEMYAANKDTFEKIKKEMKVEMISVAEEERNRIPANFLILPDKKLLFAAGMPETKRRVESILGTDRVLQTKTTLDHLLRHKFGIRCFTNIIQW